MPVIEWIPSPFYTKGWWDPPTNIAMHSSAGTLASLLATFGAGSTRRVSAHFTVDGFSGRIIQHVSLEDRAWSTLGANDFVIGVEHIDNGPWGMHPELTYTLSAWLMRHIQEQVRILHSVTLPLDDETIGPHSRWTATACPAALDWRRIVLEAGGGLVAFDPRNNPADDEYLKQTVRNVVLGEPHLTASALQRALKPHYSATPPTARQIADARKGHGKGRMRGART